MATEPQGQGFNGPPGSPNQTIGFPQNAGFIGFEVFNTLNTKPPRPAIPESDMFWCDGWMPFGPSNIRTLYGVGDSIYTAPDGITIIAFWFYNLEADTFAAILLSNGSLIQVHTVTGIETTIMAAGTIQNPNPNQTWMTQWNAKYLVIVSVQDNGYWLWDGVNLFGSGAISPDVSVTNSGEDYTSEPTITFQTTSGTAVAPTFLTTVENGFVTEIEVITPGSGFAVDDFVAVSFSGGGTDDSAQATASIGANVGQVTAIVITTPSTNLDADAYVTLTGGGGAGATAALVMSGNGGTLANITVTNGGHGYTSQPTVVFHGTGSASPAPAATAIVSFGEVSSISVGTAGTGYKGQPLVTIVGDGTGAQAEAIIDNAGQVTSVVMRNYGYGYTKALVTFSGGNKSAEAYVSLMPIGIQGSTVEVYTNRIWVGDERKGYFTAPSSPSDFTPSNGAGAFQSNDSFQRVNYTSYKQTNGFLYLISDSSVNYIGGVQTTATAPVSTVFNNLNVDPQIGSPWASSIQLFSRNIILANSFGVFVSYGGAVTKISGPLDGFYNSVIGVGGTVSTIYPSGAMASIFGIACYMLLLPVIDQYTNQQRNKLLLWSGRNWFTSSQDRDLTYISSQEINSVLTAWATDGTELFPMFQQPSTGFQKVVQSKLWSNPSYWYVKSSPYLAGILNFNSSVGEIDVYIDNERGNAASVLVNVVTSGETSWVNGSGDTVVWINENDDPVVWGAAGIALIDPQLVDGQAGVLTGFTVTTMAEDVSILSLSLLQQNFQQRW